MHFDGDTIENGMAAHLPRVAAESTELPYGSTIRLTTAETTGDTAGRESALTVPPPHHLWPYRL
ncbi:hypothetical protein KV112_20980 [Mycolicibacter sp. MYC123]|uniref:Uncharacterized protein n=1 Tax=[Mycobacterium] zoologicum TaxID=2872311 RepID=A0ABU5YQR2_9MYCO|nr:MULTISPECIES: hypothetical protein [unclassified Mycolicibacter]MEB3052181.1 hypothetical protein [Mycolicibacter sp. MYC123]MEB3063641.1 hypothetical protein [Mycolicibacter sp. MYC101]